VKLRLLDATPALALFVYLAALYSSTALGRIDSFDGEIMFRVAESLVERGSLQITDEIYHANEPYAVYGLGTSLAVLPFYLAAKALAFDPRMAASLLNPLVTAATATVLYLFGRRLHFSRRLAVGVALMFGVGTLAWPYAKTFFSEPLTAFLLLSAAYLAYLLRQRWLTWPAVGCGAALGFAVLTREDSAAVLPFYAAYLLWPGRPRLTVAGVLALGLPLAALLGVTAYYHALRFPDLFGTYAARTGNTIVWDGATLATGLYGQLLSSGKGLLFYTPLVLLAIPAWGLFWRRSPHLCLLFTAIVVERIVFFSFLPRWFGGICWGPRYIVPIVPFLLLAVGFLLQQPAWRTTARRWLVGALFALSLGVQLIGVSVFYTDTLDVPLDRGATWDQVYFVPRYSPILAGAELVSTGRHVRPLLPIERAHLHWPIRGGLVVLGLAGAAGLYWSVSARRRDEGSRPLLAAA
jgi:hypothetical protein